MGNIEKILRLVPTLTNEELIQLRGAVTASLSLGNVRSAGTTVGDTTDDHLILTILASFMQGQGVDYSSAEMLRKDRGYVAFRRKVPVIMQFARKAGQKNMQRALLGMGIELLHRDLMNIGLAATSKLMMAHIHRLPGVINRAFPGYVQAGMLSMIIRGYHVREGEVAQSAKPRLRGKQLRAGASKRQGTTPV